MCPVRLATSTFRMAMILTALRIMDDGNTASPRVCSDADYEVAMSISEVLQQHMLRVINELPATPTKMVVGKAKEPLLLQTFWDNLPDEFEAKDFKAIAQSIGLTIPTAERHVCVWTGTRLEKLARGRYRRIDC